MTLVIVVVINPLIVDNIMEQYGMTKAEAMINRIKYEEIKKFY